MHRKQISGVAKSTELPEVLFDLFCDRDIICHLVPAMLKVLKSCNYSAYPAVPYLDGIYQRSAQQQYRMPI
jgi:hypothetical protein